MNGELCGRHKAGPAVRGLHAEGAFGPLIGSLAGDDLGKVLARHALPGGNGLAACVDLVLGERTVAGDDDHAGLGALRAEDARQAARVHACNRGNALLDEVVGQGLFRAEVGVDGGNVPDDEACGMNGCAALAVLGVDADVADVGARERDDLARIGRIREDLLIAGHRRIEDDFGNIGDARTEAASEEYRAVRKNECGFGARVFEERVHLDVSRLLFFLPYCLAEPLATNGLGNPVILCRRESPFPLLV